MLPPHTQLGYVLIVTFLFFQPVKSKQHNSFRLVRIGKSNFQIFRFQVPKSVAKSVFSHRDVTSSFIPNANDLKKFTLDSRSAINGNLSGFSITSRANTAIDERPMSVKTRIL